MAEKVKRILEFTEADVKYTAYGIVTGCGVGTILGLFFENVVLAFALGGVIGIVASTIFSMIKKLT